MFNIQKIEIFNFRAFKGEHTFVLPTEPGLYSITGQNLLVPGFEAGGVGKSSLIEAIHWCWYGTTSRNLRSTEVVTWGKKWCRVAVHSLIGEVETVVTREHGPNSLSLEEDKKGRPVDNETVVKALRVGPEASHYSIFFPQFDDAFFDLKPEAKLRVFTEIMGLDFWLEKSREAADVNKRLLGEIDHLTQDWSYTKGEIDTIKADIKALRGSQGEFDRKQAERIRLIEFNLKQYDIGKSGHEKRLKQVRAALLGAEGRLAGAVAKAKAAQGATGTLKTLQVALQRLERVGPECPECLQAVPRTHLASHRKRLEREIEVAQEKVALAELLEGDIRIMTRNRDDFVVEVRRVTNTLEQIKMNEAHCKKQIADIKAEDDPAAKMLKDKQGALIKQNKKVARLDTELTEITADYAAVEYWVTGFKQIRLMLVEEALQKLEIEVNNALTGLGMPDWRVELDIERETKSGTISKGFTVMVYSPRHDKPVRYECWCGNETQRLKLAGNLGLANLIMERAGLANTVEFFDEPSQHMGSGGLNDLCDLLADRANADTKRIFLVDHHTLDYPFKGVVTITYDEDGGHLE